MGKGAIRAPESVLICLYSLLVVLMVVWSRRSCDVSERGKGVHAVALAAVDSRLRPILVKGDLLVPVSDYVELSWLEVYHAFLLVILNVA